MRFLTLSDVLLALTDLLGPKRELLLKSKTGAMYAPGLDKRLAELQGMSLPGAREDGRPMAGELGEVDARHDLLGMAIWLLTGGLMNLSLLSDVQRGLAKRVRETFVAAPNQLQRSYAEEAAAAQEARGALAAMEPELRDFVVAPGVSLYDVVSAFLTSGDELDALLARRADLERIDRTRVSRLRIELIGLLGRLRGTLTDELDLTPELEADYVDRLFAYVDSLAQQRARNAAGSPPPTDAPTAQ